MRSPGWNSGAHVRSGRKSPTLRFAVLYGLTTFFSASLLFAVEPMIGKWVLPRLGGSPATWMACLVLFQALLLAGYSYVHVTRHLRPAVQRRWHAGLAIIAVIWALFVGPRFAPDLGALPPSLGVPWLLLKRIGIPFFMLSATTPLLVAWSSWGSRPHRGRLYALSNAGSLSSLLAYPFVVEPLLDVETQLSLWGVGCALLAAALLVVAGRRRDGELASTDAQTPTAQTPAAPTPALPAPYTAGDVTRWVAYALLPSAFLLAATNHITVDVAAVPLLWVAPLALYLLTFILAFGGSPANQRLPAILAWVVGTAGIGINAFQQGSATLTQQLTTTLLALCGIGMLCHGLLAQQRPSARWVTHFYLAIAVGGALGGASVLFLATRLLNDYYELELLALTSFALLLWHSRASHRAAWSGMQRRLLLMGVGVCTPLLMGSLLIRAHGTFGTGRVIHQSRSFLGPLRVVELPGKRILTHGRIQHGMQLLGEDRDEPTMYFVRGTALGRALGPRAPQRPRRIGVVGLGVGTIAAYGRAGDKIRFYELDPEVAKISCRIFTFLNDSRATIDVAIGDGRLLLASEPTHDFDVLVLDAFTSDAVPVHLLTQQAFEIYLRQLAPRGLLLVNVSNRHLAVDRVVRGIAEAMNLPWCVNETLGKTIRNGAHVAWAGVAKEEEVLRAMLGSTCNHATTGSGVLFTDNRTSLLKVLR